MGVASWKKQSLLLLVFFSLNCFYASAFAQKGRVDRLAVAFYNVENLFDTINEPRKEDDAFTPQGDYRYTSEIYSKKLHNIATVIKGLASDVNGPAIIGLAEVENGKVLKDLCAEKVISKRGYKYVWYDGPDIRGIDVALLYDPKRFSLKSSYPLPVYIHNNISLEHSRDILFVYGLLEGKEIFILVNHWPSRREGKNETTAKREVVAYYNKKVVDSLLKKNPQIPVIIMGDLNDNPTDKSIKQILSASNNKSDGGLFNPWVDIYLSGKGTCRYKQSWQLYDQIIISKNLLNDKGFRYDRVEVYSTPDIRDKYTKQGFPYRSFKGTYWVNGYSDHFPVVMYLVK